MVVGYGKRVRHMAKAVDIKAKATYFCPSCSRTKVVRLASGVWQCAKCRVKYASGAFEFRTE